jgi:hypothetical protein
MVGFFAKSDLLFVLLYAQACKLMVLYTVRHGNALLPCLSA